MIAILRPVGNSSFNETAHSIFCVSEDKNITYQDLLQIIELIKSSSQFSEFHLKVGDIELDLKRGGSTLPAAPAAPALPSVEQQAPIGLHSGAPAPPASRPERSEPAAVRSAETPSGSGALLAEPAPGAVTVKSPMVGIFYRAPAVDARPFVEEGQRVEPDTVVCIIEVMKLMNSIHAGCAGVVTQVLVENAAPVEFGQALIVVTPQ